MILEQADPVRRMRRHYTTGNAFSARQMHEDIMTLLDIIDHQKAQMSPKPPQGIKVLPGQRTLNLALSRPF